MINHLISLKRPHAIGILSAAIIITFISFGMTVNGQRREHLTSQEIELVREFQEIDRRMEIFVRAVERRLLAIEGTANLDRDGLKKLEKERDKWGELPFEPRPQLLSDIDKILDEAISKIEDVAERDSKSELFPAAVYVLADGAAGFIPRLESLTGKVADAREAALINSAVAHCRDIVQASSQVERPVKGKKKN